MLTKMFKILMTIEHVHLYIGGQVTGHVVAENLKNTYSRATVYRLCEKAEELGLIRDASSNRFYDWTLTEKGRELYEKQTTIPF